MLYDGVCWLFVTFERKSNTPPPACMSYRNVRFFHLMLLLLTPAHKSCRISHHICSDCVSVTRSTYAAVEALLNAPQLQATNSHDKLSAKTMTTAELLLMWLTVTLTISRGVGELVLVISIALPLV